MAGDLIPPPSPAGKPPPDPVAQPSAQVEATAQLDGPPPREGRPTPAPFRSRFGFVWGALAGIALCAAGAFALLLAGSHDSGPRLAANWSSWEPDSSKMVEGAREIADHVGLQYKLDGGEQLVSVRSSGSSSAARRSGWRSGRRAASSSSSRATGCCTSSTDSARTGDRPASRPASAGGC